jgi:protein gp37
VTGCDKISPGCAHCYAETFAERWRGIPGHPYEQGFALKLWPQRLEQPLKWSRPRMIFVNSMSDLFHEQIPEPFIGTARPMRRCRRDVLATGPDRLLLAFSVGRSAGGVILLL